MKDLERNSSLSAGMATGSQADSVEDAIAIVGYAFRFPGDLADPDEFWQALNDARDLVTQVPESRWAVDELAHPKRKEPGRSITFSAGVLSRVDEFDAEFFGISPREAAWLDPQQRLLLELAWETLENAGKPASQLRGSDCAVYVGISSLDYGTRGLGDFASFSPHLMTGNTLSVAANRLSYVFDLHGPSLAVDTACSSSLVALHHACNCLRHGEASMALAGGVNMLLNPYPFIGFTKASMLSANGRCKAFDASGDGYVRAEGGAVLLLKPLQAALRDGDSIEGIIRASGVNADGARKTGITIPSAAGQTELMRSVLRRSGLKAEDVAFIEAHGTGTAVGDPIESAAIGEVYGCADRRKAPLPIGSVKANLGHLESASGMAGLVKSMLALKQGALPPALHLNTPNPHIDFAKLNLQLLRQPLKLQCEAGQPLVAGINSFGFGGANAHVLLQAPPQQTEGSDQERLPHARGARALPLVISARTAQALQAQALRYADYLQAATEPALYDVAWALAHQRDRLSKRLVVWAESPAQAAEALSAFAEGHATQDVVVEDALAEDGKLAFVYSGNGSQWVGMGRTLLREHAGFAAALQQLDEQMLPRTGFSVREELLADQADSRLDDTAVAQPLLFAIQVALTQALEELGCRPYAVCGHSVGEVCAAWACGALSLEQAVEVICVRSEAQGSTRGSGRMAVVGRSEAAMLELLKGPLATADIAIAGVNSSNNVTIAGELQALQQVEQLAESEGWFYRLLDLDYAFHSSHMDRIKAPLLERLQPLKPNAGQRAIFVSAVTGEVLDGISLGAHYWWRNVRKPVQFAAACRCLVDLGCRVLVEMGPHAILQRYLRDAARSADTEVRILPSLRRDDDGAACLNELALRINLLDTQQGFATHFAEAGAPLRLPNYPWQKSSHWHPQTTEDINAFQRRRVHPLLGWPLPGAGLNWENHLDAQILPWLPDHKVSDAVVYPGAAYVEMALAAAHQWYGDNHLVVEELDLVTPMVFDHETARTLRLQLNERDGSFQIRSRQRLSNDPWVMHASGRLVQASGYRPKARIAVPEGPVQSQDALTHYALAERVGLQYGAEFQQVDSVQVASPLLAASLRVDAEELDAQPYLLRPGVLDACFQTLVDVFADDTSNGRGGALLPVKITRLEWLGEGQAVRLRGQLRRASTRSVLADFELLDADDQLLTSATGCRFRVVPLPKQASDTITHWQTVTRLAPHVADGLHSAIPKQALLLENLQAQSGDDFAKRVRWFTESLPLFEALSLSFIYSAVAEAQQTTPGILGLMECSAQPLQRWLFSVLQQEGLLQPVSAPVAGQPGDWELAEGTDLPPASEIWQSLLRDSPGSLPLLTLMGRVGQHLGEILLGDLSADVLHAQLRDSSVAETLYIDDPSFSGISRSLQSLLLDVASQWPAQRRLRVLEVAVGGSELPQDLADQLPTDRLDYVLAFTDSKLAERQAAEYADLSNVLVTQLDGSAWTLQEPNLPLHYDVVILHHSLHLADKPHALLTRARRWLAADGLLLVAERYPDWSANLLEGLDAGWWHSAEPVADPTGDGAVLARSEPVSSLHSPQAWHEAMCSEGFEQVEVFTEAASGGLAEGAYLLLARNPAVQAAELVSPDSQDWALWVDEHSAAFGQQLALQLESHDQQVSLLQKTTDSVPAAIDHLVLMWDWESNVGKAPDLMGRLLQLAQALGERTASPHLWILARGGALAVDLPEEHAAEPLQAAMWGFARVLGNEYPEQKCTLIDVSGVLGMAVAPRRLANELLWPDAVDEVVLGQHARYALRLRKQLPQAAAETSSDTGYRLDFKVAGQLRNLLWLPQASRELADQEVQVKSMATGLNFRDVMYLMGLLPDEAVENGFAGASLGLEFSGVVERVGDGVREFQPGDRVMGFGSACFSDRVATRADALALMPETWSFAAAATVPTVYFTVYYSLVHLAAMQPGERLLVHGGAGGVGIAAIQLGRLLGVEIYATAGSDEKRDFVRLLGADRVFDSRSLAFADDILAVTDGEGVDVVLNSLAGEAIRRNLRVLRPFGRFLELGKRDFFENTPLGLRPFKDNISYFGIDADQLLNGRPQLAARLFRELMGAFREGELSPLPYREFAANRVVEAFRYMQQARHIGKVVVTLDGAQPPIEKDAEQPASLAFDGEGTWMVTGGLSGFGLRTAHWLVSHGVRQLVLLGRRGKDTPGAAQAIEALRGLGARVEVASCDVSDAKALNGLVKTVRDNLPPLRGVVHAAMVMHDRLIANLDEQGMNRVLQAKLVGAWNLHLATQDIPLDYFLLYSSITTSIGNPGQANYVAANAGLEGLAQLRRQLGLPATAIGWGPIDDVGYLTDNLAVKDVLQQRLGRAPLPADQALEQLAGILSRDDVVVSPANFDWGSLARVLPGSQQQRYAWLNSQLGDVSDASGPTDFKALIAGKSTEEVELLVEQLVLRQIAETLCVAVDSIDVHRPLADLGMDSLMAVELALGLEQHFGVALPAMMLNDAPSANRVAKRIVARLHAAAADDAPALDDDQQAVERLLEQHGEKDLQELNADELREQARNMAHEGTSFLK